MKNTFIRVAEVWVPSADGGVLELGGGVFEQAPAFGAVSRTMRFGRGEGLPGRAWDEGRPLLLTQLEGTYFRRPQAARAAGLRCAVALPIFSGSTLTSVVVLLCGDDEDDIGAVELWHNDPRVSTDLRLADGYFGATAPEFEAFSRDGSLSRGAGAPGLAWQREAAVFIEDVRTSPHFLRAQLAAQAGIVRALALPCSANVNQSWVLSLLSSAGRPMARRVESWLRSEPGGPLQRACGHCEVLGRLGSDASVPPPQPVRDAWQHGVARALAGEAWRRSARTTDGFDAVLAIPVFGDGAVSEVVVLYF